ncbi:MAG: membrane protein [Peptococcaceae bacterium BRH_c4b]|nr:MAG: membrane protein [Peptococcaceae bacterium BRH_c4b]
MKTYVLGLIVIVVVLVMPVILLYNGLVRTRNLTQNAWAQFEVQLKRRYDLISNLVETVRGYAAYEKMVLENVTRARAIATEAQSMDQRIQAENMLTGALKTLYAVAENYPQLKASKDFNQLKKELSDTESKIAFARQFYNDTIIKYNNKIQVFPSNLLAGAMGFKHIPSFEVADNIGQPASIN